MIESTISSPSPMFGAAEGRGDRLIASVALLREDDLLVRLRVQKCATRSRAPS
jgi:hypothetical protein